MDVRLIIVAVTFLLLMVAFIAFIFSAIRAVRTSKQEAFLAPPEAWAYLPPTSATVDTSLDGLELEVTPDSPSAVLLTPLRQGDWHPPAEPAPVASLSEASLAGRIASLDSTSESVTAATEVDSALAPTVPAPVAASHAPAHEPRASVPLAVPDALPSVVASGAGSTQIAIAPVFVPPPIAHAAPIEVPEVRASDSTEAPDDLSSQLAALVSPVAAPAATPIQASTPAPAPTPTSASIPAAVPHTEPAFEWQPPPPAPAPVAAPVAAPAPAPTPAPAPVAASSVDVGDDAYWESVFREQQVLPSVVEPAVRPQPAPAAPTRPVADADAVAPVPAAAPRPAAVVHPAEASGVASPLSAPTVQSSASTAIPRHLRPKATVRSALPEQRGPVGAVTASRQDVASPVGASQGAAQSADLVMVAPVEMWFGEYRVGVKAGTKTYDRFRKFADVLLADINAPGASPP